MKRLLAIVVAAVALSATSALADCKSFTGTWAGILTNPATGGTRPVTISVRNVRPNCQAQVTYAWKPHSLLGGSSSSRSFNLQLTESGFIIPLTEFRAQVVVRLQGGQLNVHWGRGRVIATGNLTRG